VDLEVVAPTGEYKSSALVTAGSNAWSFNPFYAFTWLLTNRLETSWRLHYLWKSANNAPGPGYGATSIEPGQAVHFNGAASFAVAPWLRAGVAGYCRTTRLARSICIDAGTESVALTSVGPLFGTLVAHVRRGTANVFCIVAPKTGRHLTHATSNRKALRACSEQITPQIRCRSPELPFSAAC
jgi:hypothetical protein